MSTAGVVEQVFVAVGDQVEAGQTLVSLDGLEGRRVLAQLRADVDVARNETAQLERAVKSLDDSTASLTQSSTPAAAQEPGIGQVTESLARAQTAYNEAVARERRAATLEAHGVPAAQELEDAQLGVRAAAAELALARREAEAAAALASAQAMRARTQAEAAVAELQRQRRERAEDLARARLRQRQAEAAVAAAAGRLGEHVVRAIAGGVVAELPLRRGERVMAGAPVVKVATMNSMVVGVNVPAAIVNDIKRGDPVVVEVAGSQPFPGRVRTVAPLPTTSGTHAVDVEFDNSSGALLAGRQARVRIHR